MSTRPPDVARSMPQRGLLARFVAVLFAGALAFGFARAVGTHEIVHAVGACASAIPILILLEGARIGLDMTATYLLCGNDARRIPVGALLSAHLAAHALTTAVPLGGAAAEVCVAAILSPHIGTAKSTGLAIVRQSMNLFGVAAASFSCALVALLLGAPRWLVGALGVNLAVTLALALLLPAAALMPALSAFVGRIVPRARPAIVSYQQTMRSLDVRSWGPVLAVLSARMVQGIEYTVLAGTITSGSMFFGASLVAGSMGSIAPGQTTMTAGALMAVAPLVHRFASYGAGMGIAVNIAQWAWAIVGALVFWAGTVRRIPFLARAQARA